MCYCLDTATAVNFHFAQTGRIGKGKADVAGRCIGFYALHLAIVLGGSIGGPVACIVGNFQHALTVLVQPVQAHLFDVGFCTQVYVCPVAFTSLPHAGKSLCGEYAAYGLALAHEGNLLDGPVEGIVLAEGQLNGIEFALSLQFEGLPEFACHGGSLLGLLVGVVDNLPSAWAARQGVALEQVGVRLGTHHIALHGVLLEGLVLVVCHEALHHYFVGLYVHIGPAVGQCGRAALNRYARPLAIVDGKFALVVRQGFAIGQHLQEGRLAGGHHAIGE